MTSPLPAKAVPFPWRRLWESARCDRLERFTAMYRRAGISPPSWCFANALRETRSWTSSYRILHKWHLFSFTVQSSSMFGMRSDISIFAGIYAHCHYERPITQSKLWIQWACAYSKVLDEILIVLSALITLLRFSKATLHCFQIVLSCIICYKISLRLT